MEDVDQSVNWGKASRLKVQGYGKVHLNLGTKTKTLWAFYIPQIGLNILSVGSFNSTSASFTKNRVHLIDNRTKEILATGYKENKIYHLNAEIVYGKVLPESLLQTSLGPGPGPLPGQPSQTLDTRTNIIFKWHCRLAHIGLTPILKILDGMNVKVSKDSIEEFRTKKCHICLQAKYNTKINKVSSNKKDYEVSERIHTDLGGPLPKTYNNYRYYITFLDKKTRYLVVKLLKTKDEAIKAFAEYKAQARGDIRELVSDNGTEFVNQRFELRLSEWGIAHYKTPAYTKESNGLIERLNLTLINKVRSLLLDANLPDYLWGEALLAAVYVYNRVPHRSLHYQTPYELYHNGRKGDINHLKRWGSLVYYNDNKQKTKLQPRTQRAILVGYTDYPNIFKLWDPKSKRPVHSRDLTILENHFLKEEKSGTTSLETPSLHRDPLTIHLDNPTSNLTDESPRCNTRARLAERVQDEHRAGSQTVERPASPVVTRSGENDPMDLDPPRGEIDSRGGIDDPGSDPGGVQLDNYDKEIQDTIVVKQLLYTVEDTLLSNQLTSIDNNGNQESLFLLTVSIKEPNSLKEADQSAYHLQWRKAAEEEINELIKQDTFEVVDKPINTNIIGGRWVFKEKPIGDPNAVKSSHITNEDRTIRFKARWVVQGFSQQLGIDYLETFSTTCRTETWRTLLITAVNKGLLVIQYDVKNAFVHAPIDYDVYMKLPEGFYKHPKFKNKCAKLKKALYGLKQAPRLWYQYLAKALMAIGYEKHPFDEGCFVNPATGNILIAHVDDMLLIARDESIIQQLEAELAKVMNIERIGPVKSFLGHDISINYEKKTLRISQLGYTKKILERFDVKNRFRASNLPGTPGIKLQKNPNQATPEQISDYQQQIGSLLYLSLKTRPDLAYCVNNCARYMSNPSSQHFQELRKIWGYLLQHPDLGILYNCSGKLQIRGYCDSDWAGNLDNRSSTQGYIFGLTGTHDLNPISWCSQLQKSTALSSTEAEYMALKEAIKEAIYLFNLLNWLNKNLSWGYEIETPIVFEDNQGALKLAENPSFHKRTKHIDISFHYSRSKVQDGEVRILDVRSACNLADGFTKPLSAEVLQYLKEKARLVKLSDQE